MLALSKSGWAARHAGSPNRKRRQVTERRRILVVENRDYIRELVAEILSRDGHRVDTASDGVEALALLDKHDYVLIVSDLAMPELDGPSLYRELERRWPQVLGRLIFMTANAESDDYERFLRETGVPVMAKPFNLTDLCQAVERALATSDRSG